MKSKSTGVAAAPDFEGQAEGFGLTLERKSFVSGEHEDLGAFLATEAPGTTAQAVQTSGKSDDDQIRETIQRLESTHPDDAAGLFDDTVTEPFHLFTSQGMQQVTHKNLEDMKDSEENKSKQAQFPPKKPRQVLINNLQVTHLGKNRAAATYCSEEDCANGEVQRHNVAAYLLKAGGGWRVLSTSHKEP